MPGPVWVFMGCVGWWWRWRKRRPNQEKCIAGGVGSFVVSLDSRPPPGRLADRGLGFLCPKSLSIVPPSASTVGWGREDILAGKGTWGSGDLCAQWSWSLDWVNTSPFSSLPGGGGPATQSCLLPTGEETGSGSAFISDWLESCEAPVSFWV